MNKKKGSIDKNTSCVILTFYNDYNRYKTRYTDKYHPVIPIAVNTTPEGTHSITVTNVKKGKLEESIKVTIRNMLEFSGIEGMSNNEPMYDRNYAKFMNTLGIDVLACTPKNLPEIIANLML